jgi:hypothetical protein
VNCTDGRLSGGDWGADDAATKIHALPYNWIAMMAGSWPTARGLCEHIEADLWKLPEAPCGKLAMADLIGASAAQFAGSSLCVARDSCELILTGFTPALDGRMAPVILYVSLYKKKSQAQIAYDVCAIGEGARASALMLKQRKHDPIRSTFEETCYMVYEAKRFSEVIDSVGPLTRMFIHADAGSQKEKDVCCFQHVTEEGIDKLAALRKELFLWPVSSLEKLPRSCFK